VTDPDRARDLILKHGRQGYAYQLLNPGVQHWFSRDGQTLVGYVDSHGWRVAGGDPVGDPIDFPAVAHAFAIDTHATGRRPVWFGATDEFASTLGRHRPIARVLLGAEPVWQPSAWLAEVQAKPSLRQQLSRARNKGVTVERWTPEQAADHPELQCVLAEWLQTRGLPPMRFLVEPYTLGQLRDRRVYVARRHGESIGFLVASPVPRRCGWLVEQNLRGLDAPNGTTELLMHAAVRDMASAGEDYLTLGLSPLSQRCALPQPPQPGMVNTLLGWARAHGRRFYNFDGLDAYKAKYRPEAWEPAWLVVQGRQVSPAALFAVAGAFSGGQPLWFLGRTLLRAARQEWQWWLTRRRRQP
jgi:phosphatidylglycerol lysyltransferase